MSAISKELDYKTLDASYGTYQYSLVSPQSPLPAILNGGGNSTIFELPDKIINLSKSVLSFTCNPTTTVTHKYLHSDGFPFAKTISLTTRDGTVLSQVNAANIYMKMVSRKSNPISQVQTYDKPLPGAGYYGGIYCGNQPATDGTAAAANSACRPDGTSHSTAYLEPAYMISGGTNNLATPIVNVQFELSKVIDTILAVDLDQMFGQPVYLRIEWANAKDIYWKSTSATNPVATNTAFDGNVTISGLTLYVAIEINSFIIRDIRERFDANLLSYNVPFVTMMTQTVENAGTHSLSTQISRPMGKFLKKVHWSAFAGGHANNTLFDNSNLANAKWTDFFAMANNVMRTQYPLTPALAWLNEKDKLVGSCILSNNEYLYNFCYTDDFGGSKSSAIDHHLDQGMPLDGGDVKYNLQISAAATLSHYLYTVTLRTLHCSKLGCVFT